MRLSFRGDEAGGSFEEGVVVHGVRGRDGTGREHYVLFQLGGDDDWGVHFEFDDQSNGDDEQVARCELSREALRIDLKAPVRGFSGIDVELKLADADWRALRAGLEKIFVGAPKVLTVS